MTAEPPKGQLGFLFFTFAPPEEKSMPTQSTMLSEQQLISAAKAPLLAYNEKNWDAARTALTTDAIYEEVATHRKAQGASEIITVWQSWATAFPDSKAAFQNALVSGNTVVFELQWQGTHRGPLQTPGTPIAPTGKRIDIRACMVIELDGEKAKVQRHYFDMATIMQQLGATA
jgi:steroid delta-isomerase-like uncharacterized protein